MHTRRVQLLVVLLAAFPLQAQKPPETPIREVTDTYFEQTVVDPYRWMEKSDAEFMAWLHAQDDYARALLRAIPGRDALLARITELDSDVTAVSGLQRSAGDHLFYFKSEPGSETRRLFVRSGLTGKEKLLVDPMSGGQRLFIDEFAPSLDGKYVAYAVSAGGSEASVLHVIETESGRLLPDTIDRTRFAHVSWLPDHSFFYWRSVKVTEGMPPSETYKRSRSYLHILGQDPDRDRPIFGYRVSPAIELTEIHFPAVFHPPGSTYAIAYAQRGIKNEMSIYVAPLDALKNDPIPWKKIAGDDDDVTGFAVRGDDVYLRSHHGAPRYKILRTTLLRPDLANAKTVLAESDAIVTDINGAKDALYVSLLEGGLGRLRRISYAGAKAETIPLPFEGTLNSVVTDPRFSGAMVHLVSWLRSPMWYRVVQKNLIETRLQPPSSLALSQYEALEERAMSADGVMVPLSIVLRKGLRRDGSHETILEGYGAYGFSILPEFDARRVAWLERGGILAFAHPRGGGEYGEQWHLSGQKATKMNTVDDVIACAQYLIDQKFTSPAKLAIYGASAGGIPAGRAITKRPNLFAAAIIRHGLSNPLRLEVLPGGPQNALEFGSVKVKDEFESLLTIDPYNTVKPNTPYPAVLLISGVNDPRIPPWQSAKMAARLQAATTSGKPVLLRVDFEGGHFGTMRSRVREELTDRYAFVLSQLGAPIK
jgi:prolyl oligopeptidase